MLLYITLLCYNTYMLLFLFSSEWWNGRENHQGKQHLEN